ncbi:MAG: helix-turn-helix transcriptional regulator [Raoultibacter sp.]
MLAMFNLSLIQKTPPEIAGELAQNVRARRKEAHLSQLALAKKSGVSLGSLKRFESSGEISLFSLLKIAIALDCEDDFTQLFARKHYRSIQEVIDEQD